MAEEEIQLNNEKAKPDKEKKIKKKKQLLKEDAEMEEQYQNQLHKTSSQKSKKRKEEKAKCKSLKEEMEKEEENGTGGEKNQSQEAVLAAIDEGKKKSLEEEADDEKTDMKKINKRKRRLLKEAAMANKRGICYLSRVPPHMDPFKLRQLLSQYGEIQRIYLVPEKSAGKAPRKSAGRFQEQGFSEGWAEFSDKRIAKRVANMLNGEQIGGRKRSSFYYDLWNIKYLSKFKWDDLTEEIAYNNAAREQKLALEISAAKRERDFYLSKVDQARALSSIEKRLKKKQKLQEEAETNADLPVRQQSPKVVRKFQQKQPVADNTTVSKPRLSKDILAGVFGSS